MSSNTKIIATIILSSIQSTLSNDICSQPKEVGKCRALSWRVYYDAETQTCKEFGYGGCGGNDNNFNSAVACVRTCYRKLRTAKRETFQWVFFKIYFLDLFNRQ